MRAFSEMCYITRPTSQSGAADQVSTRVKASRKKHPTRAAQPLQGRQQDATLPRFPLGRHSADQHTKAHSRRKHIQIRTPGVTNITRTIYTQQPYTRYLREHKPEAQTNWDNTNPGGVGVAVGQNQGINLEPKRQ